MAFYKMNQSIKINLLCWLVFSAYLNNFGSTDDCNVGAFSRKPCPNDTQFTSKSTCEEASCCWDAFYVNVPNCFHAGKDLTNENTTIFSLTSYIYSTTCGNCNDIDGELLIQKANDLTKSTSKILTENTDTSKKELDQLINNVLSNLTEAESVTLIAVFLPSIRSIYFNDERNTTNRISIQLWLDLFNILFQQDVVKTESNLKEFLNVTIDILIAELTSPHSSDVSPARWYDVINKIESYTVAATPLLLGDVGDAVEARTLTLNFSNVLIECCYEDINLSGCDVANDHISAIVRSYDNRSYISSVTYKPQSNLFSESSFNGVAANLGSTLFTVTSHNGSSSASRVSVNMNFTTLINESNRTAVCAFINNSDWSDAGCYVLERHASFASCTCNHNTSFALLFLHSNITFSDEEKEYFEIITYIGSGTSITALLTTIFCFFYLRLTRIRRVLLHLNLSITLCLGQIILLIGTRIPVNTPLCKAVAILLHFFFMSSFSWMLMEGILLYFQSARATKGDVNFKLMTVFGWFLPVFIVGVSLASSFQGYGSDRGCWLSIRNGLTWAFIGPSLGFILINMILLGLIVKVFLKLKSNTKSGEWQRTKRSIRAIVLLTPLLGITWLFGALAINEETKWFLYIFSFCNSLQGLAIFVFHCLHNHDVRKAFLRKYRRSFQNVPPFFSSVTPSTTGKTFVKTTSASLSTPTIVRKQ